MDSTRYGLKPILGGGVNLVHVPMPDGIVDMRLNLVCGICEEITVVDVEFDHHVEKTFNCREINCQEPGRIWRPYGGHIPDYWGYFHVTNNFVNLTDEVTPRDDITWIFTVDEGEIKTDDRRIFFNTDKYGNWEMGEESFKELFGTEEEDYEDLGPSVYDLRLAITEIMDPDDAMDSDDDMDMDD